MGYYWRQVLPFLPFLPLLPPPCRHVTPSVARPRSGTARCRCLGLACRRLPAGAPPTPWRRASDAPGSAWRQPQVDVTAAAADESGDHCVAHEHCCAGPRGTGVHPWRRRDGLCPEVVRAPDGQRGALHPSRARLSRRTGSPAPGGLSQLRGLPPRLLLLQHLVPQRGGRAGLVRPRADPDQPPRPQRQRGPHRGPQLRSGREPAQRRGGDGLRPEPLAH